MSVIKNGGQVLKALARVSMVTALLAAMAAMATGASAQDGLSKTTVTLGQSVAMTGPAAVLALPFAQGARLYFERVNAAGGIHGREIELITADDAGNPETTLANTKKLLDQRVFSLFGYYGSPQVTAVNSLLKDSDLLLFGPMAGADELRGSLYPNVYSVRPGYSEEAIVITRHAETLGMRKLAILHARDPESLAALDSAERTMTGMGANLLLKAPLEGTDKVLAVKAESVLLISAPKGAAIAIRDLRSKGYKGPIYGFSNTGESLLADQLGAAGSGVVVVRVTPKSDNAKSSLVRELQAEAAAAKLGKSNVYMLEGYIAAWAYTEALRKAGKEPTRVKLRKALDTMQEMDLGGFRIHFDGDRVGSKLVELSLIDSQGRVRE
ncbi:ABC transporter substrate-binding protein [Polaromonas sp. JS666]|uniref:ABC transporter substrate-binding protein n=1 Tax=Polaromonas sp. (strain JS666 / ATCC BAA-500) TaxID=296591 RepID=UPI0000465038|nr:ABC transporter substrate-binding protein [Polaromonas sp. JS666]ABE45925.1 amino acid/amide ABC transporter substrate-binding protein, HAAT family [Polaromonas sp. JS666]